MFRGDNADLVRTIRRAASAAVRLGHPRVGSKHLLLALTADRGPLGDVWAVHAVSMGAVQDAVVEAAPAGAGVAADRDALSPLGTGCSRGSGLTRSERRIGRRLRNDDIVRRYQHTSGRVAMSASGAVRLLGG
jgi:hypothetical protein